MGANDGQAEQPRLTRPGYLPCQTGASLPTVAARRSCDTRYPLCAFIAANGVAVQGTPEWSFCVPEADTHRGNAAWSSRPGVPAATPAGPDLLRGAAPCGRLPAAGRRGGRGHRRASDRRAWRCARTATAAVAAGRRLRSADLSVDMIQWTPTDFVDIYIMPLAPLPCQFRTRTRMATDTLVLSVSAYGCSTPRYTRKLPASHARGSSTHAGG